MELKLETPDGAEVHVEPQELSQDVAAGKAAFERAQASNPSEDEKRTPPKRQPREVVHEEDKPRRGRPSKADAARTTTKAPAKEPGKPLPPKDFTADLNAAADGLWLGASQLPIAAPYAAVVHAYQPAIVAAVNQGAQVNADVRNYVEKMTSGAGNAWMLQLAVVGIQMGMTMMQVAKNPEFKAQLVETNNAQVAAYIEAITGQSQAA